MKYATIEGLDKQLSKFIFGCDHQKDYDAAAQMWDDWIERGGNAFDTAWVYQAGLPERLLGQWIASRNIADRIVLTVKGAHTPHCTPEALRSQFESLDRLRLDRTDIYLMHHDNEAIDAGAFLDVLNELAVEGRLSVFGCSNWRLHRLAEAETYAKQQARRGFTILCDNMSLARLNKPVWAGGAHVSDKVSRHWLQQHRMTNFAWSSQARGYFLPESLRMRLGEHNFDCWDSQANRERRARAEQLAEQMGIEPINIAAAYVLCQPFPSFAIIGPRKPEETASTLKSLDVELTQDQIDWLWGEDETVDPPDPAASRED